jgi:hypothetical protein
MKRLTPWSIAAKRAWNKKIVHTPVLERNGPPFRCANPNCGTHEKNDDDCPDGWWRLE